MYHPRLAPALALAASAAIVTWSSAVAQEKDNSGTNPAQMSRNAQISNEFRLLPDDSYYNVTNLRYTEPFADGQASFRITVPLNGTDLAGDSEFGFGDISAKVTWVPYVDKSMAFILGTEVFAPTASEDILGTGKWVVAPGITWANFVSPEVIVAPALIHSVSFAGDDNRLEVNRTDFDLYLVYRPKGAGWWVTSDTTISHDFERDTTPASWELTFGRLLTKLESGGALNGYVRPGIGIGNDKPYDFNIEVGLTMVNF